VRECGVEHRHFTLKSKNVEVACKNNLRGYGRQKFSLLLFFMLGETLSRPFTKNYHIWIVTGYTFKYFFLRSFLKEIFSGIEKLIWYLSEEVIFKFR
jgi:hypothetical protein